MTTSRTFVVAYCFLISLLCCSCASYYRTRIDCSISAHEPDSLSVAHARVISKATNSRVAALQRVVYGGLLDKPIFGYEGVLQGPMSLRVFVNPRGTVDSILVLDNGTKSDFLQKKTTDYIKRTRMRRSGQAFDFDVSLSFIPDESTNWWLFFAFLGSGALTLSLLLLTLSH